MITLAGGTGLVGKSLTQALVPFVSGIHPLLVMGAVMSSRI